jgi:uncharacterized protein YfcZ (UPF0381/DUF406 family)
MKKFVTKTYVCKCGNIKTILTGGDANKELKRICPKCKNKMKLKRN